VSVAAVVLLWGGLKGGRQGASDGDRRGCAASPEPPGDLAGNGGFQSSVEGDQSNSELSTNGRERWVGADAMALASEADVSASRTGSK
jgi:hypothetical protein